ncbi:MAG: ATP-binding cassette domain-containing protein [Anaerolineae bacterium]
MPLIELRDVSFSYDGTTRAVDGVTLAIEPGEFVAVVGRNGCGKSTLCRLMNGLLFPSSGQVLVGGTDTRQAGSQIAVRSTVAMVFQVPDNQIVATVVDQDVAFGPENLGVPAAELRDRVRQSLEAVGMWQQRERAPHLLSEGEKQRVAIAGALALHPRCLILDEATSMLDPAAKRRVGEIARDVNQQGVAVIVVTHDMGEARQVGRLIALDRGTVAYDGTPVDMLSQPTLMTHLGLIAPPAARLAEAIRARQPSFGSGMLTVPDVVAAVVAAAECH